MPTNLFYELNKYEDISYADYPQAEKGGDASLSSPTDRRPGCACVELPNPTFWQSHHSNENKLEKV